MPQQEIARGVEAAPGIAEPLRGRETDQLGHHVVAVDQRVLDEVTQRRALVHRQDGSSVTWRRRPRSATRHTTACWSLLRNSTPPGGSRPGGAPSKRASCRGGKDATSMRPPPHHATWTRLNARESAPMLAF